MIEIRALGRQDWKEFSPLLQEFENVAEYPYGDDYFRLDHGENYFAFFERLGEPLFHIATDEGRIVACAAGVLREMNVNGRSLRLWYLCDLKVDRRYAAQKLPGKLLRKNLVSNYLKCGRGYGISMNPAKGRNRVVRLIERFPWVPIRHVATLNFYSFDRNEAMVFHRDWSGRLGNLSYLSLEGKKDLIMRSTGTRLPLFHIQHGGNAQQGLLKPEMEGTYMICATAGSDRARLLEERFQVSATASIVAHRMAPTDWNFVLTSDI